MLTSRSGEKVSCTTERYYRATSIEYIPKSVKIHIKKQSTENRFPRRFFGQRLPSLNTSQELSVHRRSGLS